MSPLFIVMPHQLQGVLPGPFVAGHSPGCMILRNGADHIPFGQFPGPAQIPQPFGERVLANYRTAPDGWIRFELTDRYVYPPQETPALEGFCFEDMEPLSGNCTHRLLSWSGGDDLSAFKEGRVAIRVRLHKATLFSITIYGADDDDVRDDPRYPV